MQMSPPSQHFATSFLMRGRPARCAPGSRPHAAALLLAAALAGQAVSGWAAEAEIPLCPVPEETAFACPLRAGGGLQVCVPAGDQASPGDSRVVLRVLAADGSEEWAFGGDIPAGEAYKANFFTNGALTLAHLRFQQRGVEHVLVVGEDQTQGLAGLGHATAPGTYAWRMCDESWKSRLDYRFYAETRIPADPVAAPLP